MAIVIVLLKLWPFVGAGALQGITTVKSTYGCGAADLISCRHDPCAHEAVLTPQEFATVVPALVLSSTSDPKLPVACLGGPRRPARSAISSLFVLSQTCFRLCRSSQRAKQQELEVHHETTARMRLASCRRPESK